jgi:predicted phage tail protein
MNKKLVKLNFHGDIGNFIPKKWELAVDSVKEALLAVENLTNGKYSKYFIQNNKLYAKYRVLINGRDFISTVKELNETNYEELNNSELIIKGDYIKSIDIVPILEGHEEVIGALAIIVGVILLFIPGFQPIGIALIAAGVAFFLTRSPKFQDFRKIDKGGGESYLFGGPVNTVGEGGPCPVGYGKVLIGSQVISSSYKISDYQVVRNVTT